ncbi:tryptophan 2,3-dioxygenase [Marisediminicola antarctica]|uniref:Tryptophan 2,3-dioxygenase n=1 Tax=Marisediminicola antarctica TaxID=674079 RepID=A0A7L5AEX0_9MICO|nr:tryptophan 2,3-dioxygenase family protein [Marisediminicola antarctica]QHO68657.1 tryptophan 2,3-dioxygenase [Marisediminicola antarctica]
MSIDDNTRPLEPGITTDFSQRMNYGSYLALDELLSIQRPQSSPAHHDEMLFIIQHQTSELWIKLLLHELRSARDLLRADDIRTALKRIARVKHIQEVMTQQWSVLATLTPSEYSEFRDALASSSGFQSHQYRAVEFIFGNKNEKMLAVFDSDPASRQVLSDLLDEPSLYDELLRYLSRAGHAVPDSILNRDVSKAHTFTPELVPVFKRIYENAGENWEAYEACEEFVDLEDNFQFWRFRHLKTVGRTIGTKMGTGGSSGVEFLQRALSLTFFPELFAVRSEIGR